MASARQSTTGVSEHDLATLEQFADKNLQASQLSEVMMMVPSLVQRGVVYLITAALFVCLGVLYFGKIHVVVATKGSIVPEGEGIRVQAIESGVVTAVLAHVGDRLPAGAPLLQLDRAKPGMDLETLTGQLQLQESQMQALHASVQLVQRLLDDPERSLARDEQVIAVSTITPLVNACKKAWLDLQSAMLVHQQGFQKKKQQMLREMALSTEKIQLLEKNAQSGEREVNRAEAELVKKQKRLDDFKQLVERGIYSELDLDTETDRYQTAVSALAESRRRREQIVLDISNERLRLADLQVKVQAGETESATQYQVAVITYRQSLTNLRQGLNDLHNEIKKLDAEMYKNRREAQALEGQLTRTTVVMPLAGTVVSLDIKDPGGVLSSGTLVATVVPDGAPLVVKATVPNKDIGFVSTNLPVSIKVDAYPFQQFGTLPGRVQQVFPSVDKDQNFTITIALLQDTLGSADQRIPLFPGLTVQADLLTRKQRLLHVLFSHKGGGS